MCGLEGAFGHLSCPTPLLPLLSFYSCAWWRAKPLCKPGLFLEGCTARDTFSLAKERGHQMVLTFLSKAPCGARALSTVQVEAGEEGRKEFVFAWPPALAWGLGLYKEDEDTVQG